MNCNHEEDIGLGVERTDTSLTLVPHPGIEVSSLSLFLLSNHEDVFRCVPGTKLGGVHRCWVLDWQMVISPSTLTNLRSTIPNFVGACESSSTSLYNTRPSSNMMLGKHFNSNKYPQIYIATTSHIQPMPPCKTIIITFVLCNMVVARSLSLQLVNFILRRHHVI